MLAEACVQEEKLFDADVSCDMEPNKNESGEVFLHEHDLTRQILVPLCKEFPYVRTKYLNSVVL